MAVDGRASRRSILGRGALVLGSLAGSLGLVSIGERVREGALGIKSPAEPAAGMVQMVLHGSDWHLHGSDLARGRLPQRGDRVSIYGQLAPALGAAPDGEFHASSMFLDTPLGSGPHSGQVMEIHNFTLPRGTLVGVGAAAAGDTGFFTVVGGSGRYLGATGGYSARQEPQETGGDGTAIFKFDIRLAEGGTDGGR
jgi:hypothetical protein